MSKAEAQARYEAAMERRRLIVEAWVAADRPLITLGGATGRTEVPHPYVRMIQEADALCDRLYKSVRATGVPGRPTGSESAPDRATTPPQRVKLKIAR